MANLKLQTLSMCTSLGIDNRFSVVSMSFCACLVCIAHAATIRVNCTASRSMNYDCCIQTQVPNLRYFSLAFTSFAMHVSTAGQN